METKNIDVLKTRRLRRGFTLIELLVVIAIIGIVAALVTGLAGRATKIKKINRVRTEMEQLDTVIESYKEKKGFYPPSNGNGNNSATNQLFYELVGTFLNNNDFEPINGSGKISAADASDVFGVDGFANSSTERGEIKNFFTTMKASQAVVFTNAANVVVQVLAVPVEGPNDIVLNDGRKINPWRYNSSNPTHNPESFDLWAEILVGGKTTIIGNWKD